MKIAYLVLAHKNPKLIQRMINYLSNEDCAFFIHIDSKSNFDDFISIKGDNVFFVDKRIPVYWGEYSMVEAILVLIRLAIVESKKRYDYLMLLSGSDYPLRSKEYIHSYFNEKKGLEFISLIRMPNEDAGKPLSRINTLRIASDRPFLRIIVKILAKLGLAQRDYRKHLGQFEPYAGSTWWALTREACQHILNVVDNNKPFCKYFEETFASDEMIFHTIIGNSKFKKNIVRNMMYDDWAERGAHPAVISEKNIAFFEKTEQVIFKDIYGSGEMLFARKISDERLDLALRIEEMVSKKKRTLRSWLIDFHLIDDCL